MTFSVEVRPGDLVLVTHSNRDPLGNYVTELDGSPWSHCGIATHDGRVASCHAGPAPGVDDQGGIRYDEYAVFTGAHRELWRARPDLPPDELTDVVRFVEQFSDDGRRGAQQSGFSFLKLFLVSCGLNARSRTNVLSEDSRDAIYAATARAARAASWTFAAPNFFCSEFAAAAYGRGFEEKDFDPPVMGGGELGWLPLRGVQGFLDRLTDDLQDARAKWAAARLVGTVLARDAGFLLEAFATVRAWEEWKDEQEDAGSPSDGDDDGADEPGGTAHEGDGASPDRVVRPLPPRVCLPTAMVTPRMLAYASWMGTPEKFADAEPE